MEPRRCRLFVGSVDERSNSIPCSFRDRTASTRKAPTQCPRASDTVELIGRHRVMTPQQIHTLLAPPGARITNTYKTLRALREEGVHRHWSPSTVRVRLLVQTEEGLRIAYANAPGNDVRGCSTRTLRMVCSSTTWLTNEIGAAFVAAAQATGDECTWRSWDHEITHGIDGGVLITDAVLSYVGFTDNDVRALTYFVEVDRLTKSYDQVLERLRRYARYATYAPIPQPGRPAPRGNGPHWRNRYITFPTILFVAGDEADPDQPSRERSEQLRVERVLSLAARDREISSNVSAAGTTSAAIARHGVTKAIWRTTNGPALVSCLDGKPQPTQSRPRSGPGTD